MMNRKASRNERALRTAVIAVVSLFVVGRFLVELIGMPRLAYFALFPALIVVMLMQRSEHTTTDRLLVRAVIVISLAVLLSAVTNLTDPLVVALLWSSLSAPFVVILVVYRCFHGGRGSGRDTRRFLLTLFFAQSVVVGLEVAAGQWSDDVQGFLSGQGAGHHVTGFVGALLAILFLGLWTVGVEHSRMVIIVIALGGATVVATSTNQAVLALIVAGITLVVSYPINPPSWVALVSPLLLFLLIVVIGLRVSYQHQYAVDYVEFKGEALSALWKYASETPEVMPFGFGPGQSLTRTSWNGIGTDGNLAGLIAEEPSPLTLQLFRVERAKPPWQGSSLVSIFFSLGGIVGDLGLFGLGAYLVAWWFLVSAVRQRQVRLVAATVVGTMLALGAMYNWLEEPVLMTMCGLGMAYLILLSEDLEAAAT